MNTESIEAIQGAVALSHEGKITFGQVVGKLLEIGVERYHTDYSRNENTYYMPDGQTLVVPLKHGASAIAQEFSAAAVEAAIRQSQRGEIVYAEFVKKTSAAGCVGYFAQLAGKRVLYFGRKGEVHIEPFPGSAPAKTDR